MKCRNMDWGEGSMPVSETVAKKDVSDYSERTLEEDATGMDTNSGRWGKIILLELLV